MARGSCLVVERSQFEIKAIWIISKTDYICTWNGTLPMCVQLGVNVTYKDEVRSPAVEPALVSGSAFLLFLG